MKGKLWNAIGSGVGILVLIGLTVLLSLTLSRRTAPPEPASTRTAARTPTSGAFDSPLPTPTEQRKEQLPTATVTKPSEERAPTTTPTPDTVFESPIGTPTSTAAPTPVPRCAFAAPSTPAVSSPTLDIYAFSEPQVVLTHTLAIGVVGWLPDGERLLIVRDLPGTNRQNIETFDVHTGVIHKYAERRGGDYPLWLAQQQAVVYSDWEYIDKLKGRIRYDLWVSWGEPEQAQRAAEKLSPFSSIAVDPGGRLVFFPEATRDKPHILDVETRSIQPWSLDLARWKYPEYPKDVQFEPHTFNIAWRPDDSQVIFYTRPWTFLFDTRMSQVCEVDLGHISETRPVWVLQAKWSPDGRYLALETTDSLPGELTRSIELTILDIETGGLRTLQPAPVVTDMAWAPDGRHLAVLGIVRREDREEEGIFIIDPATGGFQQGPSDYDLGGGSWGWQLAWSPDGSHLAVNCPTTKEGRLCIISVALRGD